MKSKLKSWRNSIDFHYEKKYLVFALGESCMYSLSKDKNFSRAVSELLRNLSYKLTELPVT